MSDGISNDDLLAIAWNVTRHDPSPRVPADTVTAGMTPAAAEMYYRHQRDQERSQGVDSEYADEQRRVRFDRARCGELTAEDLDSTYVNQADYLPKPLI